MRNAAHSFRAVGAAGARKCRPIPAAASCSRIAAACLAIACGACAGLGGSPREPYATLPPGAPPARPAAGSTGFRVLDDWRWTRAVESPDLLGAAAGAVEGGELGVFPARQFRVATGECEDCAASAAALWWFRDELIAVPDRPVGLDEPGPALPPVLWLGAPQVVEHASLSDDAKTLTVGTGSIPFVVPSRLPTNAAYADGSTARFFAQRPLTVRGATASAVEGPLFVARTIWPEDARLDVEGIGLEPLRGNEFLGNLIEAQVGAIREPFPARLLFERNPGAPRLWAGKPAIAFVLSGAQGDDDGARGGHLAIATGLVGRDGEWRNWIANNFYPLAEANAKGIVPASVPLDNYLLDLNSGQLYYRPGYMLVAVLRRPRLALAVQEALQETMLRLYCGAVEFDLARFNSTAMTIDPLRALGWRIPRTGPTSRIAGIFTAPFATLARLSLRAGRNLYATLAQERTRLLPRVAFEVAGHDLLYLAGGAALESRGELTAFERMLVEDVEAILFVHLPQVPSSRRFGTYPVVSLLSYGAALLADPGDFERAPEAGTRDFPEHLGASCPGGAR